MLGEVPHFLLREQARALGEQRVGRSNWLVSSSLPSLAFSFGLPALACNSQ